MAGATEPVAPVPVPVGRYFGGFAGAGSVGAAGPGAPGAPGAGGAPPGGVGSVPDAALASFSVIMPIVHPGELSRIKSKPFIAREYFALSSASKKMTGGPCVASFDFAARYQTLRRSAAFSSVSV